jgi:hypothetical protein
MIRWIALIAVLVAPAPASAEAPTREQALDGVVRLEADTWSNTMRALGQARADHEQTPTADRLLDYARRGAAMAQEDAQAGDEARAARDIETGWRQSRQVFSDFVAGATAEELRLVDRALMNAGDDTARWLESFRADLPDAVLDRLDAAEDDLAAADQVGDNDPKAAAGHARDAIEELDRGLRDMASAAKD